MPKITAPGVLVLDGNDVITGKGAVVDAPPRAPAGEILDRLSARLGDNGQILITDSGPRWDQVTAGESGDWKVTGGPAWFTARRDQSRLRIGILPEIPANNDPLLGGDLVTTAVRHQVYADLTGVPFYGDGGSAAMLLLDATISVKGRQPLRKWDEQAVPAVSETAWPGGGLWETPHLPEYHAAITLDANCQYLWGVTGTYLPLDAPRHTRAIPFDQHLAGYWHIPIPPNPEPRLPHPAGHDVTPGSLRWVTTPTAQLLALLGCEITVTDSWTCPRDRSRRAMDPWYQVLRDARAAVLGWPADRQGDSAAVARAIKDTYSRGISHLGKSPDRRWYRPDWRNTLFASARCSMWRALWVAGTVHKIWPVVVQTDAATYEQHSASKAFKIGNGVGEWKVRPQ